MTKYEKTVKAVKGYLADLKKYVAKKTDEYVDDDMKAKANEIVQKTIDVANVSIDKIESVLDQIKDDEKFEALCDRVQAKTKEAVDEAKAKIDSLGNRNNDTIDKLTDEVMAEFNKLKENETFKNTTEFIKDVNGRINAFLDKPEVKATISKAKKTTVTVAEAGLEGIRSVLNSSSKKKTKKKAAKKTAKKSVKKVTTKKAAAKPAAKKTVAKKPAAKKAATKKIAAKKTTKKGK